MRHTPSPSPIPGTPTGSLAFHAISHKGLQRPQNQDRWAHIALPQGDDLFLVADGMGGAEAGGTASQLAISSFKQSMLENQEKPPDQRLAESLRATNRAIYEQAQKNPEQQGMGSTLVGIWIDPEGKFASGLNLGDSRAYLFRQMQLMQLTRDDSMTQELIESQQISEAEAGHHPQAGVLSRALGPKPEIPGPVEAMPAFTLHPGDLFLLCSDGLTGVVSDQEIGQLMAQHQPGALNQTCDNLVNLALQRGGPDNITALVIQVPGPTQHAMLSPQMLHTGMAQLPMTQEQMALFHEEGTHENRYQRVFIWLTLFLSLCLVGYFLLTVQLSKPQDNKAKPSPGKSSRVAPSRTMPQRKVPAPQRKVPAPQRKVPSRIDVPSQARPATPPQGRPPARKPGKRTPDAQPALLQHPFAPTLVPNRR